MNIQYISDSQGITTGVFIPINEWNALKSKYSEIEKEEANNIPQWHKNVVSDRLANFKSDRSQTLDFDQAIDDIENNF